MRRDWELFYADRPETVGRTNYLSLAMHRVHGTPVPEGHFRQLCAQICDMPDLQAEHRVPDLCCGNGLFTRKIARPIGSVVAVDQSEASLGVAP